MFRYGGDNSRISGPDRSAVDQYPERHLGAPKGQAYDRVRPCPRLRSPLHSPRSGRSFASLLRRRRDDLKRVGCRIVRSRRRRFSLCSDWWPVALESVLKCEVGLPDRGPMRECTRQLAVHVPPCALTEDHNHFTEHIRWKWAPTSTPTQGDTPAPICAIQWLIRLESFGVVCFLSSRARLE